MHEDKFKILAEKMVAKAMIVLYSIDDNERYIEHHEIKNGKPLSPKPLTIKSYKKFFKTAINTDDDITLQFKGIIPKNLIYFRDNRISTKLIWIRKAAPMAISFVAGSKSYAGIANMPPMLFIVDDNDLAVYALAMNFKTLTQNTKLYDFKLWNMNDGNVCLGTFRLNQFKDKHVEDRMKNIEMIFSKTSFTPHSFNDPICKKWIAMMDKKLPFDTTLLTPYVNKTAYDIIKSKIKD